MFVTKETEISEGFRGETENREKRETMGFTQNTGNREATYTGWVKRSDRKFRATHTLI